jgi:hypothetical protein
MRHTRAGFGKAFDLLGGEEDRMREPVCTENRIRVDDVMESPKLAE